MNWGVIVDKQVGFAHLRSRYMRSLLFLTLVLLTGCDGAQEAALVAKDPSQLLSAYASLTVCVAVILWYIGQQGTWRAILNSIRVTALVSVVTGPLFYVVYDNAKYAEAITLSGILGLAVVTAGFWKDLYPTK